VCDINGKVFPRIALLVTMIVLAACRTQTVDQGPFVAATATATPRSTPLPVVATLVPPGIEDNAIHMVVNPVGSASLITGTQITNFEDALAADSDLVVEVTVVGRYAEALAALCDSTPTNVTVAWLDGLTYQAAVAQNCGEPVMQIERGTRNAQTGEAGQIVTRSDLGLGSLQTVRGRTFCRISYDDYFSWLVPSVLLQANGISPISDFESIVDYDNTRLMVNGLLDDECSAAGMSETEFADLNGPVREQLEVLEETPSFPYAVLMYPFNLPLGERIRLDNALLAANNDPGGSDAMRPFLEQDDLQRVSPSEFDELSDFLERTGLDFAQLGD
jgi:ABC-type phosphate/phosphonate transport system substrate-binding protein